MSNQCENMLKTACERWDGYHCPDGYARLPKSMTYKWQTVKVTRHLMSEKLNRQLGPKELVCHTCDNRWCINIDHLYVGTHADNARDCVERHPTARESAVNRMNTFNADPNFLAKKRVGTARGNKARAGRPSPTISAGTKAAWDDPVKKEARLQKRYETKLRKWREQNDGV